MKTLSLLIALVLTVSFTNAQENETDKTITVTIENITNNNGQVILSLHTADTFMKGSGIQNIESKIKDGKIAVTFKNVKPGTYAIMHYMMKMKTKEWILKTMACQKSLTECLTTL